MNKFTIEIDNDELEELQEILAGIYQDQPKSTVTAESYLSNIVRGYLRQRITNAYVEHVKKLPLERLKSLHGLKRNLRKG